VGTHVQGPTARKPRCARQSHLVLGGLPSAVPCARLHARLVLAEWDLKPLAETAELIVSELVTNAVRASGGLAERRHGLPTVRLWLSGDQERVLIEVWDADERMPVSERPDPTPSTGAACSSWKPSAKTGEHTAPPDTPARSSGLGAE
jgi:anti-sigma regulatory factor (Ser/Thr protein kinase)